MLDKDAIKGRRDALSRLDGAELLFSGWMAEKDKTSRGGIRISFTLTVPPVTHDSRIDWMEFIGNAPIDIDDLLVEIERLEAELVKFKEAPRNSWDSSYELFRIPPGSEVFYKEP